MLFKRAEDGANSV